MEILDLQDADKLENDFSNYVTGYTKVRAPYLVNDNLIQQAGLPSGERLEDDYPYGFNGEQQSNFQLFGIGKPSAKQIARRAKKNVAQQITGCVKPKAIGAGVGGLLLGGGVQQIALLNKYKKDMKAYNQCLLDAKNRIQSQGSVSTDAQKTIDELNRQLEEAKRETANISKREADIVDDKIMGIPKTGFWIGVGALALVGGFIFYKKVIAKK